MTKPLNIGMIGYGFMAKAHSNAYRKVGYFFPELEHRPVLRAVAARDAAKVSAFADVWGYESVETDWRRLIARDDIDAIDICTPNNLHKEIAIAAAAGGQVGAVREAARHGPGRRRGDGRGGRARRRAEHGLVQLSPRAGDSARAAADRRGPDRPALPLPRAVPAGLDDGGGPAAGRGGALAPGCRGRGLGRHGRPSGAQHRCGDVAERADHPCGRRHGDVHQGARAPGDGAAAAGRHRRCLRLPGTLCQRRRWAPSRAPAMPAATRP